jgi:hypothetical protein
MVHSKHAMRTSTKPQPCGVVSRDLSRSRLLYGEAPFMRSVLTRDSAFPADAGLGAGPRK